jgi:DNA polymerase epsilon subunit 1
MLLDHIYRWISSPVSLLHDPNLLHYVHSLMKKVFLQLLAEFRTLGASIIYASFHEVHIQASQFVFFAHKLTYFFVSLI